MKKVLLIGGSGYLGSHLLKELIENSFKIYATVHHSSLTHTENIQIIKGGIQAITVELLDEIKPDVVFHCARPTLSKFRKWGRKISAYQAAMYNKSLLKNLQNSSSKPLLVFASGSLMYGNSSTPHDEDSPLQPISYAAQYIKGEMPILKAISKKSLPIKMVRLPWLLGNGSWFKWFFLNTMEHHQAIPLFGDGSNYLEIVDIDDAAKFMIDVGLNPSPDGAINMPSEKAITQQTFASTISKVFDFPLEPSTKFFNKLEPEALEAFTSNILLTTKHNQLIGSPTYTSLEETLKEIKINSPRTKMSS